VFDEYTLRFKEKLMKGILKLAYSKIKDAKFKKVPQILTIPTSSKNSLQERESLPS